MPKLNINTVLAKNPLDKKNKVFHLGRCHSNWAGGPNKIEATFYVQNSGVGVSTNNVMSG